MEVKNYDRYQPNEKPWCHCDNDEDSAKHLNHCREIRPACDDKLLINCVHILAEAIDNSSDWGAVEESIR